MEQRDLLSNDLLISNTSITNLTAAAKWGKFLAIVGFIFCGLMILVGIYMQTIMSSIGIYGYGSEMAKYMGIVYVILAIIFFVPCLYLLKFSNKMLEAARTSSQESIDSAFSNLKSMFKFYGIVTIVILVIYALAFLAGMGSVMMK